MTLREAGAISQALVNGVFRPGACPGKTGSGFSEKHMRHQTGDRQFAIGEYVT
jgi:hypothetical protein